MTADRVAYVMNGFPRLSETFITHEIHQLERLGMRAAPVLRQARERAARAPGGGGDPRAADLPAARQLALRHARCRAGWPPTCPPSAARTCAWRCATRCAGPARWARRCSWPGRTAAATRRAGCALRKVFIKEFLQAGEIADDVLTQPATSATCTATSATAWPPSPGWPPPERHCSYSFTAHAKDIYQAELNPGDLLERKMHGARFVATCTCANAAGAARTPPAARRGARDLPRPGHRLVRAGGRAPRRSRAR